MNVICSGDFWQLDPPDGGFLGSIPTEFIQNARLHRATPTVAHGQSLFWSGADTGIAGITELHECERCADVWLREVQEEMRHGQLSADNHSFLHGLPTSVPGSWEAGDVLCLNDVCRALASSVPVLATDREAVEARASTSGHAEEVLRLECNRCRKERRRKELVLRGLDDPRYLG